MSTEEEYDTNDMKTKSINLGLWLLGFTLSVLIVYVLYDETLVKMTNIFKKADFLSVVKLVIMVYCLTHIPVIRLKYDPSK